MKETTREFLDRATTFPASAVLAGVFGAMGYGYSNDVVWSGIVATIGLLGLSFAHTFVPRKEQPDQRGILF